MEQVKLDGLTNAGFDALEDTPHRRWGLVPANFSIVGLVTHLFIHTGWLHLLVNMLFLYLLGPFVEDVWGRRCFAGFYLAAGVVAAVFFALRFKGLNLPLVGASGAVAAVMGAFMVRHWDRKIRFFYWFGVAHRGTFHSPAWVILPLWFLRELLSAYINDVPAPGTRGPEVAYWTHAAGFAFGAGIAAVVRWYKLETRFLAPTIDAETTVIDDSALERALDFRAQGRTEESWLLLRRAASQTPNDPDVALALWDLAVATERTDEAAPVLLRLIKSEMQRGEVTEAYHCWSEMQKQSVRTRVPIALETKLAEDLRKEDQADEATEVLRAAVKRVTPDTPPGALIRLARVADGEERAKVAALALAHTELPGPVRREMTTLIRGTKPSTPHDPSPVVPKPKKPIQTHQDLKVARGVPLALQGDKIALELEGSGRGALSLARIQAVAAAAIAEPGPRPNLVMDLLLERAANGSAELQVIRCESSHFDPCKLMPSENDVEDAFLSLVGAVLTTSGAVWLLGGNASRLRSYTTLLAYEQDLLSATRLGII